MSSRIVRRRGRSANIFISYRHEDSAGHAGRLFDALRGHFAGRLFRDIDNLQPGVDFLAVIEKAVGSCKVLIVLIGHEWLTVRDSAGHRRLDDPADFIRLEVEAALAREIRVIPVLVQGAPMPRADELPPSLSLLARRHAIELSDARWAFDVDHLARTIHDILRAEEPPGPRVWLLSLAALVLVAAAVLAFVLRPWFRWPWEHKPVVVVVPPHPGHKPPAATLPRTTITSPGSGEKVGDSILVQGTVVGLGNQRVFLCIRQPNGVFYPRGELFPNVDGQWSMHLRSSKEQTFEILVVASASQEAAQVLSDQASRDDGLRDLPAGASISGGAVAVKRKWKPFGLS